MKWLRSIFGLAAGGLNLYANGHSWKQVLVSLAIAGVGIAAHLTGLQQDGTMPGSGGARVAPSIPGQRRPI